MKVDWKLTMEDLLILTVFGAIVTTTMVSVAVIEAVYGVDDYGYKRSLAGVGLSIGMLMLTSLWMIVIKLIRKRMEADSNGC